MWECMLCCEHGRRVIEWHFCVEISSSPGSICVLNLASTCECDSQRIGAVVTIFGLPDGFECWSIFNSDIIERSFSDIHYSNHYGGCNLYSPGIIVNYILYLPFHNRCRCVFQHGRLHQRRSSSTTNLCRSFSLLPSLGEPATAPFPDRRLCQ
jgi:hypothetical protein